MLWKHYPDQAALDAQFTLDSIVDLSGVMQRRLMLSAKARAEATHRLRIPYGPGDGETLDLFYPAPSARPAPVLVFIHGGFWRSLDAATFSFVGGAFAPAGALVAVLDYPLIPAARMAGIVASIGRALAFLAAHAAEHGGDPQRLHVGGHSAGGQLAAIALDPQFQERAGVPRAAIRGGVAISGVFELLPVALSFQQESLGLTPEEVAAYSPARHVPAGARPLIVAAGGAETQEFLDQSIAFAELWRGRGNEAALHVAAQANHIDILTGGLAPPEAPLHRAVLRQMDLAQR